MARKKQAGMYKLVKASDAKPPQRFGRDVIEDSLWFKEFLAAIKDIGPNQYGEFKGLKSKVQQTRRRVIRHIAEQKLPLYTYVVTNDDQSQSLYVVGR